jgi:hypothetical protein
MTGSSDSSEQSVAVEPVPPAPVEPVPEPEPQVVLSAFPIDSTPPPSTLLDDAIERPWRVEHQDDLRVQLTFTPPRALSEVEVRSTDDRNYARPRRVDVRQDDNGAFRVELPRDRDATASISLDGSPVSTLELRIVDVWPGRSRDTRTTLSIEQLLLHPAATP